MTPRILLVNPPIYDFAAYDFWLKPYGLLEAAGRLRGLAEVSLFDFLGRSGAGSTRKDPWGRGRFPAEVVSKPDSFKSVPRRYRRYGIRRARFRDFLQAGKALDFALVQTSMTYWYPGVREVIEDLRLLWPRTRIVLGGPYATLCSDHARSLGADLVVEGSDLNPLWQELGLDPGSGPAYWEGYDRLTVGALKLTDGCPFKCSYCATPMIYPAFAQRPVDMVLEELDLLARCGAADVAFYDDALLYRAEEVLLPFLERARSRNVSVRFHTPNALHARFMTRQVADAMVRTGFETFYLGYESASAEWLQRTGAKVSHDDLAQAVDRLRSAGAAANRITAYVMLGHPDEGPDAVEEAMRRVQGLGIRIMLSEFSPIPGTPDGERCRRWVDLDEPLWHNNTAFPILLLGNDEVNRLKQLRNRLNGDLDGSR